MHSATLDIACGSADAAAVVWAAVRLELQGMEGDRAVGELQGPLLRITLEADDLSALRAGLTSAARLCDAALQLARLP